jgi:DNA ligase-1
VSGAGAQARRRELLHRLFAAATAEEQRTLVGLLTGELRQGAQAGVLADALARAAGAEPVRVRRALLLTGELTTVAAIVLGGGSLDELSLRVGRPLAPMLAGSAPDVASALAAVAAPAFADAKLDGVRIQVHRAGADIAVFTRSLDDVTDQLPAVVAAVRELPLDRVVLDGEALALDDAGRPLPFQQTASRAARRSGGTDGGRPVTPYFFDALHLDGTDLIDAPLTERWAALSAVVPPAALVARREVTDAGQAEAAFAAALAAGHEGLVIKSAGAPYDVGRRGAAWIKVKPRYTLDLVVLAAEWGHGRRRGWLSNLHLAARDPAGGFVMLGKTFKGLTDELLRWQTRRLLDLAVERPTWGVIVRPELVVEVAFDGVQDSTRYPGGVALRFARVLRYRGDKPAAQADTIAAVRALRP